jgi:hypothetical protein
MYKLPPHLLSLFLPLLGARGRFDELVGDADSARAVAQSCAYLREVYLANERVRRIVTQPDGHMTEQETDEYALDAISTFLPRGFACVKSAEKMALMPGAILIGNHELRLRWNGVGMVWIGAITALRVRNSILPMADQFSIGASDGHIELVDIRSNPRHLDSYHHLAGIIRGLGKYSAHHYSCSLDSTVAIVIILYASFHQPDAVPLLRPVCRQRFLEYHGTLDDTYMEAAFVIGVEDQIDYAARTFAPAALVPTLSRGRIDLAKKILLRGVGEPTAAGAILATLGHLDLVLAYGLLNQTVTQYAINNNATVARQIYALRPDMFGATVDLSRMIMSPADAYSLAELLKR